LLPSGLTATPWGARPTEIVVVTVLLAAAITDTLFEERFVT
jgi:hypothetical protein